MAVWAVVNQKGGVGKTTTTLGLAAALQQRGRSVVIVDLDPQAGATKTLGVDTSQLPTLADLMLSGEDHGIDEVVVATGWGVDVAPADVALASHEQQPQPGGDRIVATALANSARSWDVVLIDCPPQLGSLAQNGLVAADHVLIVTEPSYTALSGISDLLATIDVVQRRVQPQLTVGGVVVNMMDHTREAQARLAEVREGLSAEMWEPPIPRRAAIREAAGLGVPLHARSDAASREAAAVYDKLATHLDR